MLTFLTGAVFVVPKSAMILAQVTAPEQAVAELQTQAGNALDEGLRTGLDALAPKNYERAQRAYSEAQALISKHGDTSLISIKLKVALEEIESGRKMAKTVRTQLPTVLAARSAAREARADTLVPPAWQRAEQQLNNAIHTVESGKTITPADADDIAGSYRAARRDALRRGVLKDTWTLRDEIDKRKGEELVPVLTLRLHQAISRTEAALAQENLDLARAEGANAARLAHRTLDIMDHIERAQKTEAPWEAAILPFDDLLDSVAFKFDASLDYSNGVTAAGQPLLDQINRQQDSLRNRLSELELAHNSLEQSLSDAQTSLADAQNRMVELERRMTAAEGERSTNRAQLQVSSQLSRAQSYFTPGEATVLQNDHGQVVIRLLALRFASGATKLDKAASKLLDKAVTAVGEFTGAAISVEGNTDSDGSEQANQELSAARAQIVSTYLANALKVPPDQVVATGFGESRPIADNNTREGKAMNRRIEIVLTLSN